MTSLTQAEHLHKILIQQFGGSLGIRDTSSLASALSRPFQTFEGNELYPTAVQKAASLIESILVNHPFIDGNKRTGYVLMRLLLIEQGYDIKATQEEKYNFVIRIASGKSNFNDIIYWLEHYTIKLNVG
jgi:death-on-curing protein